MIVLHGKMGHVLASQREMLGRHATPEAEFPDEKKATLFRAKLRRFQDWGQAPPNARTLNIDYNAMVTSPGGQVLVISRLLIPLDVDAMCAVVEPQRYRNRP